MAPDYILDEEQERYENQRECNILYEASIHISNNSYGREEAIAYVRDIFEQRDEAQRDGNYVYDEDTKQEDYLVDGLDCPKIRNKQQVEAIYSELCENEGISEYK